MPAIKKRGEEIKIYVSAVEKKQIERMASLSDKKVSNYVRDVALSQSLDTAKMEFYININTNLTRIIRSNHVLTRLVMLNGSELLKSDDKLIKFFYEMVEEAENKYPLP